MLPTKTWKEMKKGDIIYMDIPFEENTKDYYNGYDPQEIRGGLYKDRNGMGSKMRYVVVIGREENSIQYLPLTSRQFRLDSRHQYELQDNSMTYRKRPDMKSYVEIDSLRSIDVEPESEFIHQGTVTENDMVNIMVKLGKRKLEFESNQDQRTYVSTRKSENFEKLLEEKGYALSKKSQDKKVWKKEDGRTITKTNRGLVKYHVPLSKEEVAELVARREGKSDDFYKKFGESVADITENKQTESGVAK